MRCTAETYGSHISTRQGEKKPFHRTQLKTVSIRNIIMSVSANEKNINSFVRIAVDRYIIIVLRALQQNNSSDLVGVRRRARRPDRNSHAPVDHDKESAIK